jgi:hypothetical protein
MASRATEVAVCTVVMDAIRWRLEKVALLGAALAILAGCGSTTTTNGGFTPAQEEFHVGCQGGNETYCN